MPALYLFFVQHIIPVPKEDSFAKMLVLKRDSSVEGEIKKARQKSQDVIPKLHGHVKQKVQHIPWSQFILVSKFVWIQICFYRLIDP